ncbi:MAG: CHAD domain-containing protein [Anaerolineae bacterium]
MAQEIDARYLVPDPIVFDRLRRAPYLDDLALEHRDALPLSDTYLDTPGRALMRQGYACRIRRAGGSTIVTLKGPRQAQDAAVARPQWELALERAERFERWPAGEVRSRVQELTGGSALVEIVGLRQRRHRAILRDGERAVAELCLDEVRMAGSGLKHTSLMLEAELFDTGTSADLERLDAILVKDWGLVREPRSKLQRALSLVETSELLDADLWRRVHPATPEVVALRYGADLERTARTVAMADRLCTVLGAACGLSAHHRDLLEAAAWLHDVGRAANPEERDTAGRDIVLRTPLAGLNNQDQQTVAAALFLQRGKLTPDRLATALPATWPETAQREALQVAALLRLAIALRRSLPDAAAILEARPISDGLRVVLYSQDIAGEEARRAARRAARRTDLWEMASDVRIEWASIQHSEDGEAMSLARPAVVLGIDAADAMPTVVHKIVAFYYQQMLAHEAGTRSDQDPEELHAMRVATRRLRSALRLLRSYLSTPLADSVSQDLQRLDRALGAVRDMDVALVKAETYSAALPEEAATGLEPMLSNWRRRRALAWRTVQRTLESRAYARFHEHMNALLEMLRRYNRPVPESLRVGQVAPQMVHLYWQATRVYTSVLPQAPAELLHLLRFDCRRLRFALEFFGDVLPPETSALVHEIIGLQGHLGTMRDEAVTIDMIDAYLERPRTRRVQEAVLRYRAACEASRAALEASFPKVWARLDRASVTRSVARML